MSSGVAVDFGVLLNLAFGAFKQGLHADMADAGFTDLGSSFGYVFRLLEAEPLNLRDVAERLDITPQGALKVVDEMVAKGYVERRADPADGRVKRLALTSRGTRALARARRFHQHFESELSSRIGERRAAGARAALEDIVAQAGGAALRPL